MVRVSRSEMATFSFPSLTTIVSVAFLAYMANSLWTIGQLFIPPHCDPAKSAPLSCLTSHLDKEPHRRILLFTSPSPRPTEYKVRVVVRFGGCASKFSCTS